MDIAVGIAHGDNLGAESRGLFAGEDSHVAAAGDHHGLTGKAVALQRLEHLLREIAQAVAGGLGPGKGAAEGQALAGEDRSLAGVLQALVLAEQVANLAAAHADITGGHIRELADVAVELRHKALAEAHDLGIGLALGVKVAAALAAADGQAGEAVFQNLLKAEELQNGQVHRGVEPQAALVGADGGVELHPEAPVHLYLAGIVRPGHAEHNGTLRLYKALQNAVGLQLGMTLHHGLKPLQHLVDRLMKLLLIGVTGQNLVIDPLAIRIVQHGKFSFQK